MTEGNNSRPNQPRNASSQRLAMPSRQSVRAQGAGGMSGGGVPASVTAAQPSSHAKRNVIIGIVCAVVAIAIAVAVWFAMSGGGGPWDSSAREGQAPYKTAEEMQAEVDRKVEEGMFNISIASTIDFDDGQSEGVAYIENVPGNNYNMQVQITEDGTGDVLYESGLIKPNSYIESIKLDKDLDAGSHSATATFSAMDPETNEEIGQAAAKVTMVVAN